MGRATGDLLASAGGSRVRGNQNQTRNFVSCSEDTLN